MKIKVKAEVSKESQSFTFTLEDLSMTQEEWDRLDKTSRREMIQIAIDNEPDQPYWLVDTYEEQ